MTMTPAIRLAAATPLYAPVYLAYQFAKLPELGEPFKAFRNIRLEYAPSGRTGTGIDPLIRGVITTVHSSNTCEILAVGDPLRMVSALPQNANDLPHVVGGLITKMCFSLLVSRDIEYFTPELLRTVVVHPRGWTSYSLYWHFRTVYYELDAGDVEVVEAQPPGEEEIWYHAIGLRRYLGDAPDERVIGLVSSDLFRIMLHHGHDPRFHAIRRFYSQKPYDDALMTALITGADLQHSEKYRARIQDVCGAIGRAIERLRAEPDFCAYYLQRYADSRIRFKDYSRDALCGTLTWLRDNDVYNRDPALLVTEAQVQNALDIRRAARLPDHNKISIVDEQVSSFFNVRDGAATDGGDLEVDLWRRSWNDETNAAERTAFRDSRMPLYVLLALAPVAALVLWGTRYAKNVTWTWQESLIALGATLILIPALRDLFELALFLTDRKPDPRIGVLNGIFNIIALPVIAHHAMSITASVGDKVQDVVTPALEAAIGFHVPKLNLSGLAYLVSGVTFAFAVVTTMWYWIQERVPRRVVARAVRFGWKIRTWARALWYATVERREFTPVLINYEQLAEETTRIEREAQERMRDAAAARAQARQTRSAKIRVSQSPEASAL